MTTTTPSSPSSVPVLRVSEPRDLVALVPYRLGFVPRRSLALLSLRGPRSRIGLVLRVDLPVPGEEPATCAQVAGYLRQDGADRTVAVVYDDADDEPAAHGDLLTALRAALGDVGVRLLEAWQVGGERFRSLTCSDDCCPAEGWPVAELQGSRVGAEMVGLGLGVAPGREHLLPDLSEYAPDAVAAVRAAVEAADPGDDHVTDEWQLEGLTAWRWLVQECRHDAPGPRRPFDEVRRRQAIADVIARMDDPYFRDALLLTAVPGAADTPELLATGGPDHLTFDLLDDVFDSEDPLAPDPDLLAAVRAALVEIVRHVTGEQRSGPLAAMAWASWWEGDGARAGELADLSLAACPTNRLARLVDTAVRAGMAPAWVVKDRVADLAGVDRSH